LSRYLLHLWFYQCDPNFPSLFYSIWFWKIY
jgi:hypothetical protein